MDITFSIDKILENHESICRIIELFPGLQIYSAEVVERLAESLSTQSQDRIFPNTNQLESAAIGNLILNDVRGKHVLGFDNSSVGFYGLMTNSPTIDNICTNTRAPNYHKGANTITLHKYLFLHPNRTTLQNPKHWKRFISV